METVTSVLVVSLAVIAICATVLEFGLLYALREKIRLIHEIVNLVDSKTKDLNAKVDIVKSLYDSLDDGQAQLNRRVQHLEMLNSNGGTLTDVKGGCPYTLNGLCGNPFHDCIGCPNHGTSGVYHGTSGVMNDTVSTDRFEPIDFTKEE